ncbi:hypothetical protein ACFE04_010052 [Oxalis oulophora]
MGHCWFYVYAAATFIVPCGLRGHFTPYLSHHHHHRHSTPHPPESSSLSLYTTPESPSFYTTPESTPLSDSPSSVSPSSYIVNHKQCGANVMKILSEANVSYRERDRNE